MNQPFTPAGMPIRIAANIGAPIGMQVPRVLGAVDNLFMLTNISTVAAFVGIGNTAVSAAANAVLPAAGVPATAPAGDFSTPVAPGNGKGFIYHTLGTVPVLPGQSVRIRADRDAFFSASTLLPGGADMLVTPGV